MWKGEAPAQASFTPCSRPGALPSLSIGATVELHQGLEVQTVEKIMIERWWPHLEIHAKEWLRENLRAEQIPEKVQTRVAEAGGPVEEPILSEGDWEFIETQSEFVD
jgi:hypothetical protein